MHKKVKVEKPQMPYAIPDTEIVCIAGRTHTKAYCAVGQLSTVIQKRGLPSLINWLENQFPEQEAQLIQFQNAQR